MTAKRLWSDERGATAVEYSLILACIFLAIIGAVSTFAGNESAMYTRISNAVSNATH